MPTYLVRTIEAHDLVGIFVAPNLFALAQLVDECTEPQDCEYQRMKAGGVIWTSPAVVVPIQHNGDDVDPTEPDSIPWSGASLTERWQDSLYAWSNKGGWRPIPFDLIDLELLPV